MLLGSNGKGCRASTFHLEMRHISQGSLERKCAVMDFSKESVERFVGFLEADSHPSAVVAVLPKTDESKFEVPFLFWLFLNVDVALP